jgi:hypothetical protein
MKLYTYTQKQMDAVYSYLMDRPLREAEGLVGILRNPIKVDEAPELDAAQEATEALTETTETTETLGSTNAEAQTEETAQVQ